MRSAALAGALAGLAAVSAAAPVRAVAGQSTPIETSAVRVVTVLAGEAQGAAFAYGKPGRLLTNAHVVGTARTVQLLTDGGRRADGTVVAVDRRDDLALIDSRTMKLRPIAVRAERAHVGESVYAVGSPLGLEGSVSRGIVSAVRVGDGGRLQTDAAVNPGNSGGPLLDRRGRVLGVTTSMLTEARGIAFAVPIARAATLRPGHVVAADSGDNTGWITYAAVGLAVLLLAAATVLALLRRRRVRARTVRLRQRASKAATTNLAAPVSVFDPEPTVRLRPRDTTHTPTD
ncbi:S1C family serine protease [Candidatus Solirubrobacter pratensis]|uniref:S1C family serine protease n=1 Tax=Candidatus Solirubrobacter pratensis TaxID=1298857 RepID=UPI0003FB96BE|nr:trypsin-like peptidase domain-containing protein [Candidatus Solirubrobacter pratensis]